VTREKGASIGVGARFQPAVECALYSPVLWLLLFVAAKPFLIQSGFMSESTASFILTRSFAFLVAAVGLLPLLKYLWSIMVWPSLSRTRVEQMGRSLTAKILNDQPISDELKEIASFAEEGNVDDEHFEAALWLWFAARYDGDYLLEREAREQVQRMLLIDRREYDSRYFAPIYVAWRLRAEVRFAKNALARRALPPAI
jgi:hypothetical protein